MVEVEAKKPQHEAGSKESFAGFLLVLLFYPEDGVDILFRNVG
jgi:hypothetical protein